MIYHLTELIERTKRHVGQHETRGATIDIHVLRYVNDAVDMVCSRLLRTRDGFFCTYYDLTLDGSLEYTMPLGMDRVALVEDITGGSESPLDTNPVHFESRLRYIENASRGVVYYFRNGLLGVPNKQSGRTLRVYYPNRPKRLFRATADSATSTTVTLTSDAVLGSIVSINDWYNGMYMVDTTGEFHEVTDFVGSTGVFTCGPWITTPTDVSLSIPISARFQSLIHLEAGIDWRLDLDDPVDDLLRRTKDIWADLEGLLVRTQTQRSKSVKHIPR